MSVCVTIDSSGYVVEALLETYPDCSDLALVTPQHLDRMTYWADLAIALEPGSSQFNQLALAILMAFVTAWGVKQVARLILNR